MRRSECPISYALDHLGDKWSLLLLRDLAFYGKKSYGELQNSKEGIATNILSNRLNSLEKTGFIAKQKDPNDGRKLIYLLTEKGIDTIPVMIEMMLWSHQYSPDALAIPEQFLARLKNEKSVFISELTSNLKQQLTVVTEPK